jgi:hypothetical protein
MAESGDSRRLHNRLAETMIHIFGEPLFASTALLQEALGRLRAVLLQLLPEAAVART